MLESIKIINFKWIKKRELNFSPFLNVIVWDNWVWKTNILESISNLFQNDFFWTSAKNLVNTKENLFYIEWNYEINNSKNILSYSYDKNEDKKNILLNKKKVTKTILNQNLLKVSYFLPTTMNLFYLWPKYRRDFLDNTLINCFKEYNQYLKEYEKILKTRNKILKNIQEWNSLREEISFWDEKFIDLSQEILNFRLDFIKYLKNNIKSNLEIFWIKISKIDFVYNTKIDLNNIKSHIKNYLEINLERDIIIWKTQIWPHLDDFDIILDDIPILEYASRWETKSIIICLKLLEISYIEEKTWLKPIFLIDDLTSELDEKHIKILVDKLANIQTIITSISQIKDIECNYIFI